MGRFKANSAPQHSPVGLVHLQLVHLEADAQHLLAAQVARHTSFGRSAAAGALVCGEACGRGRRVAALAAPVPRAGPVAETLRTLRSQHLNYFWRHSGST